MKRPSLHWGETLYFRPLYVCMCPVLKIVKASININESAKHYKQNWLSVDDVQNNATSCLSLSLPPEVRIRHDNGGLGTYFWKTGTVRKNHLPE